MSQLPELRVVEEVGAGLSFPCEDAALLASRMKDLLADEELRRACGVRGRAWAASHTWDRIALQYEAFPPRCLQAERRQVKVLQIIYESLHNPYGFGGAGVRAYEIYRRLCQRHDITLLCMKYPGAKDGETEGLRHVFVGTESASLPRSVLAYTLKAGRYVNRHGRDYDVIVENFLPSTPFFTPLLTTTPVVLQVQGILESHALAKYPLVYGLPMFLVERYYPKLYRTFIFVSPITEQKMMERFGTTGRTSQVIPYGVSNELLEAAPHELDYILFFSRIDIYTKGLDILAKPFERIAETHRSMRLVIAGYQYDPFEKVRSLCHPAVRERVQYAGFVSGRDKRSQRYSVSGSTVVISRLELVLPALRMNLRLPRRALGSSRRGSGLGGTMRCSIGQWAVPISNARRRTICGISLRGC